MLIDVGKLEYHKINCLVVKGMYMAAIENLLDIGDYTEAVHWCLAIRDEDKAIDICLERRDFQLLEYVLKITKAVNKKLGGV